MKTIEEIKKEVANECAEEHFEVLLDAELSVGNLKMAKRLLTQVVERYIAQYAEIENL